MSSLSACGEFTSVRAHVDKLARKRALRLEAVHKKQEREIKVLVAGASILSRLGEQSSTFLKLGGG